MSAEARKSRTGDGAMVAAGMREREVEERIRAWMEDTGGCEA